MNTSGGYASWTAVSSAIKAAASKGARAGGPDVNAQIVSARVDRFLSRVFADGEESGWLLKGGTSMLARVPRTRATKDVDLAAGGGSLDDAIVDLQRCAKRDLGDHLGFELTSSRVTGGGDNQLGVQTRRVVFSCRDQATGRKIGDVPVDVVVGDAPVGEVETREPVNRLELSRPLRAHPYRLYPVVDQVADKVCATMATGYPGGMASSRVKDLVDLVVLARTQRMDLDQLRVAIATKSALSGLKPFASFAIPPGWGKRYRALASTTPAAGGLVDAEEAAAFVGQVINPALGPASEQTAVWVPGAGWADPDHLEAAASQACLDDDGGGYVRVRRHVRSGWPVRAHWRAPRGAIGQDPHPPRGP
ncbi:MAG: nucleotidyl transferase AbiEii/AbiGii toxin family protein [Terracoccus sp.]